MVDYGMIIQNWSIELFENVYPVVFWSLTALIGLSGTVWGLGMVYRFVQGRAGV